MTTFGVNCQLSTVNYLKNFVGVFVLFHIIFSADNALGIEHSFAFQ
ncbi:MAG: hypothetical protein HC849_25240, partial [Oscillatoriales cyanobacterium RU_3_3]|nr:hypothetical protein [Oscillatoriales cyanobacterium RU_3_3]